MTEPFIASNGIEITMDPDREGKVYLVGRRSRGDEGQYLGTHATASPKGIVALREFFQHERDEERDMWRSSKDRTWTAVRRNNTIYFQNEDHERNFWFVVGNDATLKPWSGDLQVIAREYMAVHPERPRECQGAPEVQSVRAREREEVQGGAESMTYSGLVHGLDEHLYHRQPGLSSTGAKKILQSPAHYRHYVEHPEEPKAGFDLGSAVHSKVLGVGAQIAVYPDGNGPERFEYEGKELDNVLDKTGGLRTAASKAFEADARDRGLIPVKRVTARVVDIMAESVLSNPTVKALLASGDPEVSMFATDPDTGVALRGRLDWLGPRIVDLKTTAGDASESEFAIHAFRFGYDIQQAMYQHTYHLITGETRPYLFAVVEAHAPYLTAVHVLGADELLMARRRAREARERYARAIETGEWPGYKTRSGGPIGILQAPVWNINAYLDEFEGSSA